MNDNKKFWQRFAGLYSPFMEKRNGKLYDEICAEISAKLQPDMNVLELACGSGQLTFRLAGKVKRWEAILHRLCISWQEKKEENWEHLGKYTYVLSAIIPKGHW